MEKKVISKRRKKIWDKDATDWSLILALLKIIWYG